MRAIFILLINACFLNKVDCVCYDQSPFWFLDQPRVESLYDDEGNMLSNKVRVIWGELHNFKCVDYFQVKFFQKLDPDNTVTLSTRIDRHMRYQDIDVEPCTEYTFKVEASEDYQGRREDFKAHSGLVSYKLDYTPRFMSMPSVKELKIRKERKRPHRHRRSPGWGNDRSWNQYSQSNNQNNYQNSNQYALNNQYGSNSNINPYGQQQHSNNNAYSPYGQYNQGWQNDQKEKEGEEGEEGEEEEVKEPVMIRVSWRMAQIDYPTCLDYFVLDYYDMTYNESTFSRTINKPFPKKKPIQVDIHSDTVPCDPEFRHVLRVFGLTGAETRVNWTPTSCVYTTPPPSTTKSPDDTGLGQAETLDALLEENDQLRAKIEGLNEEYSKIGLEVFKAFTDDFFKNLESSVEGRHEAKLNATDSDYK